MFVMQWSDKKAAEKNHSGWAKPLRLNPFGSKNRKLAVNQCKCKISDYGVRLMLGFGGKEKKFFDDQPGGTFDVTAVEVEGNKFWNKSRDQKWHNELRAQIVDGIKDWIKPSTDGDPHNIIDYTDESWWKRWGGVGHKN